MKPFALALSVTLLAGCAASDSPADDAPAAEEGRTNRGTGGSGTGLDAGFAGADVGVGVDSGTGGPVGSADAGTTPTRDAGTTSGADSGGSTDPGSCTATTLAEAIDCQVAANDAFVDGFCDCFTDTGYDGDRAACEADQPGADAFEPEACVRAALLSDEPAAVENSLCYAAAARDLAACISVCPPDEDAFNACFTTVTGAFDACDASMPPELVSRINDCSEGPVDPPSDVATATAQVRSQRSSYVSAYCSCYVGPEFPDAASCQTAVENQWDPGLSACEQSALSANPTAAVPFLSCVRDSFLIAETACAECPTPGNFEYELCADLSVDLNFCFIETTPELQDALLACSR